MEPFWEPNGHGAPHTVKYESDTTVSGFSYCNDGGLNFAASTAAYSEDDGDFGSGRRGKASRQDPLSHRIIEKRRRDRMNSCLADLSRLIPPQYQRKGRGRIEKTEIIEMSIRYMKQLQHQEYLHRENMYKLGYEECLQQAANYLYTGHHRDICYQMVDHLKELMKGECLKIRNNNHSTLDSVSASSGSPPSSHHHLNGAFHPVAPLSQLRDMLTASDTEHSSDHHDLHDQHDDHEHDHHLGHEDDGGGHHHLHHHHDEDDVKDLSLRRTAAAAAAAAVAAANGVGNKPLVTSNAMVGPRSVGQSLAAPSQQAPVITSSSIMHAAAVAAAAASAATGSSVGQQNHQQQQHQQQHQQQQRQPPLHSVDSVSNTDFDSSASRSSSVHLLHHPHHHLHNHLHPHHHDNNSSQSPPPPPSSSLQPMRSPPSPRHHDHDADHHHHQHDDDHHHHHHDEPDQPDQALRAVRLRKLSHDTTATCAHDIIDHQHVNSYKFKNYIQQRFSQDSHNHHHEDSRTPSPIGSIGNGVYKKMKLRLDYDQSISCDEKPPMASVNGVIGGGGTAATAAVGVTDDCKPEVSAFPMFKSMQPASVVPIPTAGVGGGQLPSAGGTQMVPIFALHSHGRFYVPLSVEYAALVPYLNGVDLLDKQSAPLSPPLPPPGPPSAMASSAPPLHSININVNFAGSTMAAAANAASAAASVLMRPKIVVGGASGGAVATSMPPIGTSVINGNGAW